MNPQRCRTFTLLFAATAVLTAGVGCGGSSLYTGSSSSINSTSGTSGSGSGSGSGSSSSGSGSGSSSSGSGSGSSSSGTVTPPTIIAVTPNSLPAGSATQTVSVTGVGFVSGATATFLGIQVPAAFVSSNQVTVTIPAADMLVGGTDALGVVNPDGGTASTTFSVVNPPPVIQTLTPPSALAGALPMTLTITGVGLNAGTSVTFNNVNHLATVLSVTSLSITLTGADLESAGVVPVAVTNPTPGGGSSAPINFVLNDPPPVITSFTPASSSMGAPAQTILINGTGFVSGSSVNWNGSNRSATFISSTELSLDLAAADLAAGGNQQIAIQNPSPGGGTSATVNFPVDYPAPTLSTVAPASATLGTATTVTLTGTNFVPTATVTLAGPGSLSQSLTPTAVTSTQLTVSIPAADLATAATTYTLTAVNPGPGGGNSAPAGFAVDYPSLTLTSMLPVSAPQNSPNPVTVTLGGSGFTAASTVSIDGTAHAATVTGNAITMTLAGADLAQSGIFPVVVTNPSPGGGQSNSLFFSIGEPTSSPAGIAVVAEKVNQLAGGPQTLDVAYLPMEPAPGGTQAEIDVVVLDTIDLPPFLPINGLVTSASPSYSSTTSPSEFINVPPTPSGTPVLKRILLPVGFNPSITVADTVDNQVLVSSIGSAQILVISTAVDPSVQVINTSYTLPGVVGPGIEFSDIFCTGVCDLKVDQSGVAAHAGGYAMTPNGFIHFNPVTGAVLTPALTGVDPSANFGYTSTNNVWSVLSPYYTPSGVAGLQMFELGGSGAVANLTNPVGTRPFTAVIDPSTQLAVVADEGTGVNTLLNLFQPPNPMPASFALPATTFYLGTGGTWCQTRPDWTMTSLDASTHLLLSAQQFADCMAVTALPSGPVVDPTSGGPTTPVAPVPLTQQKFGIISAPQGPYVTSAPWGTLTPGADPDGVPWSNGGDPHRLAVFTSVLTGKPTALLLEPQFSSNSACPSAVPGVWLAETPINDMSNVSGASGVGEVSPTQMAELSTFLRIRVPSPSICGPGQVAQGTTVTPVTITGAGFIGGSIVEWDGTAQIVTTETPTSITFNLNPAVMTIGNHTITVINDPNAWGSIGGTATFTIQVTTSQ